ncbi:hypothetical protein [Acinetobacter pollinis]|uniref:Uncharacterized protein n=1 Tax=Acinetobacter pollinis TaxID=2605270 RepID=A0ABU6DUK5_9GAMM|nr:hypothetical protein [Acinetobacter pollinis]MEB5477515.1 hypothetical protein [Acinetobacter pollinis]
MSERKAYYALITHKGVEIESTYEATVEKKEIVHVEREIRANPQAALQNSDQQIVVYCRIYKINYKKSSCILGL